MRRFCTKQHLYDEVLPDFGTRVAKEHIREGMKEKDAHEKAAEAMTQLEHYWDQGFTRIDALNTAWQHVSN